MPWHTIQVPLHPRTRRTADGTYYTHDGTGQLRVRAHHVVELSRQGGVAVPAATRRRPAGPAVPPARPVPPSAPTPPVPSFTPPSPPPTPPAPVAGPQDAVAPPETRSGRRGRSASPDGGPPPMLPDPSVGPEEGAETKKLEEPLL